MTIEGLLGSTELRLVKQSSRPMHAVQKFSYRGSYNVGLSFAITTLIPFIVWELEQEGYTMAAYAVTFQMGTQRVYGVR